MLRPIIRPMSIAAAITLPFKNPEIIAELEQSISCIKVSCSLDSISKTGIIYGFSKKYSIIDKTAELAKNKYKKYKIGHPVIEYIDCNSHFCICNFIYTEWEDKSITFEAKL